MNDEDKKITIPGGYITEHEDGSTTGKSGPVEFTIDEDGNMKAVYDGPIAGYAIANILDLASYELKTDETATSHHMVFRDGGYFRVSYRSDGSLIESRGNGVVTKVSNDGYCTIMCRAALEESKPSAQETS